MNNKPFGSPSGWTPLKVIGMIVGVLGIVGFGFSTLCGLTFAALGMREGLMFAIPAGLLTALFIWIAVRVQRSVNDERAHEKSDEHE